jgi:ligand-binding sensor domain-containing protein/serine phosphatase RsbU (regulator of sigma subunit)
MKLTYLPLNQKIIRYLLLMIFLFVAVCTSATAQKYYFERYGAEEGLASSKVYSILQDKNDYIWLGNESGVSRFDGSSIENFSSGDGIQAGGVFSLCLDSLGRIWFGHLGGGLSYYENEKFIKVRFDSIEIHSDITSIRQSGAYLWITSQSDGAVRAILPDKGDTILVGKQYRGKDGLSDQVFGSYIDRQNNLYCIAEVIKKYIPDQDRFETFAPEGLTRFFMVIVMFEDSKGNFWFGTQHGGLYKLENASGTWKIYDQRDVLSGNWITSITEDYKGDIWVGTWKDQFGGGGITVFSGEKSRVYNSMNGLEALNIHSQFEDKEKNMLIADHYKGLTIFKGDQFITYSAADNFLPENNVWAITQDKKGRFWFGTNAGLSVYNPDVTGKNMVQIFNEAKNSIGEAIRFLRPDSKDNIWIGTYLRGLFSYNLKTNKFVFNTRLNSNLYANGNITALEVDNNDNIWIGNDYGLAFWDAEKEELVTYTQEKGLAGNLITALYCDSKGTIWIGSDQKSGLTKYDPAEKKFTIVNLGGDIIPKTITETPDGRLWIGTVTGLFAIKADSVVLALTEDKGLLSNNIKLLQPDGGNFLYIGTNIGLNRYDLTSGVISSFTKKNGFVGIETHDNASFIDSEKNLWFGTAYGVTMLSPEKLPPVNTEPLTHISKMLINNISRQMEDGLKLNYKEKAIIFDYYSVCLTDPDAVKYMVMLEGADVIWRPPTNQTRAIYSALSPGHYTFMVRASNSYGYWDENPVAYSFIIKPPFYLTPWFISLCIIIVITGVILYISIREKNLIREKKILEAKVIERTAEVVQKSAIIEEKNRDITASIRYAERIQRAMLPPDNTFPDTFVLFLPKDIVSGDFYWMYDNGDWQFIAAVDCTGHGVPGAFMSIIGHNSLNKVVREYGLTRPAAILDQLNIEVMKSLLQSKEKAINDGMDLSLIAYNKKRNILEFAGAYNPLYLVRNGEVIVYKADRFPIGMSTMDQKKTFTNVTIDIQINDMLYLCSDGYADQFGSPEVKKFKTGNVKRVLSEIWNMPINDQKNKLEKELMEWKGELSQVDDIMFIGRRIT